MSVEQVQVVRNTGSFMARAWHESIGVEASMRRSGSFACLYRLIMRRDPHASPSAGRRHEVGTERASMQCLTHDLSYAALSSFERSHTQKGAAYLRGAMEVPRRQGLHDALPLLVQVPSICPSRDE